MGRIHKSKPGSRGYAQYTQENLEAAISDINGGRMSITKASKHYKIAKGTLFNKIKKKHGGKVGRPLVFSEIEERSMVHHILTVAQWGYPFDTQDLRHLAKIYIDKCGRKVPEFRHNFPSSEWAWRFLQRHKGDLSQRFCQNLKKSKAAVTPEVMTEYFSHLQETLQEENTSVPPDRIFNYDETNLSDDPGVKRCIFKRGVKYPERIRDSSKSSTSLMYCGSAAGKLLPPYVVYKSGHLWQSWMEGGPPFTRYNRSLSGWFDSVVFEDWFQNLFLPLTRKLNGRVILIGDNLSSHFSPNIISLAESHNVSFVCIPPNTTHLAQPLDVAFYAPLKKYWRNILDHWKGSIQKRSQTLSKDVFPKLLKSLHEKVYKDDVSGNIISGFKKCGIVPFNPSVVIDRMPKVIPQEEETVVANFVSDAVLEMLRSMRQSPSKQPRQRRKKVNTPPGKGITLEELNTGTDSTNTRTVQQKRKAPSTADDTSESEITDVSENIPYDDSSDDVIGYLSEDSTEQSDMNNASTSTSHVDGSSICDTPLKKDEFVIVKVPVQSKKNSAGTTSHKFYIGQVKQVRSNRTCDIMYLRKKSSNSSVFVWPQITDNDTIDLTQVELRLHTPDHLKRGFRFVPEQIEQYNLN